MKLKKYFTGGKLLLLFISLSVVGCVDGIKELTGTWVLQSDLPVYYRFNEDKTFVVNFVNPQTKRVMAVSGGFFSIDGDQLTLRRDSTGEELVQKIDIKENQMTWITLTDVKGYSEKVVLKRIDVDLYSPESFYLLDLDSQYNTYLK